MIGKIYIDTNIFYVHFDTKDRSGHRCGAYLVLYRPESQLNLLSFILKMF